MSRLHQVQIGASHGQSMLLEASSDAQFFGVEWFGSMIRFCVLDKDGPKVRHNIRVVGSGNLANEQLHPEAMYFGGLKPPPMPQPAPMVGVAPPVQPVPIHVYFLFSWTDTPYSLPVQQEKKPVKIPR